MSKRLFERFAESMKQHNEIASGARAPSREVHIDAITVKELRASTKLGQQKKYPLFDGIVDNVNYNVHESR